jgi:hypothetical protein
MIKLWKIVDLMPGLVNANAMKLVCVAFLLSKQH